MPRTPTPPEGAVTPAEAKHFKAIANEVMVSPRFRMGKHQAPESSPHIGTLREKRLHAAVKLYDKGAELQLPTPCTRLEITIERSRFKTLQQLMPDIISLAPLELSLAFDELPPVVQAVIIHPDLYERMRQSVSRNTWAKHKSLLVSYKSGDSGFFFTLPEDQITQIESYVRSYIAGLPSAHLRPEVIA